ncbi:MAG: hypothetical protein ABI137_12940 [Antricoccus sp.]
MRAHHEGSVEPVTYLASAARRAAQRAILAPSIFNTQPWQFVISDQMLDIYADFKRQLRVLDPQARQLHISCGCAILNARIALEAMGYTATREWLPDSRHPAHLARIRIEPEPPAQPTLAALDELIALRASNYRGFIDGEVPAYVVRELAAAAETEHAVLIPLVAPALRRMTAAICEQAAELQNNDPAYRAETRYWTTTELDRSDGILESAASRFWRGSGNDTRPQGYRCNPHTQWAQPTRSTAEQCLLVLGTVSDEPLCWLHAGEALERVLLVATGHQIAAEIQSPVIEMPHIRPQLRKALGLSIHPHVILRVGRGTSAPPSRRRRPGQMIHDRR